jgi:hypothetical protein
LVTIEHAAAMESAEHNEAKETAATYQAAAALREVESGNPERARIEADAAVKLAPNRDVRSMAALALARAGIRQERRSSRLNWTGRSRWTRWSKILAPQYPGGGRIAAQRREPGPRTIEGSQFD